MDKLIKIAITGPESTGKSMIAEQLADHYNTVWVPEYARIHLLNLGLDYNYDDILEIAKRQQASEKVLESLANKILFCDTELLVTKIWCEVTFKQCHPWIMEELKKQDHHLYLLMDTDLPWEYDPLREHPEQRKFLFDLYVNELERLGFNYRVVRGKDDERLKNAVKSVEELMARIK
ncbi:MAG: ATP-binding protein [Bacteroidales bacterium]|nr:ATP-binding protein [Bacteroidales bacterium]